MKIGDLVRYLSTVFMSKTMPNTVGGSIYADTADVYDIGSEDKPFHHIYAQEITAPLGGGGGGLGTGGGATANQGCMTMRSSLTCGMLTSFSSTRMLRCRSASTYVSANGSDRR